MGHNQYNVGDIYTGTQVMFQYQDFVMWYQLMKTYHGDKMILWMSYNHHDTSHWYVMTSLYHQWDFLYWLVTLNIKSLSLNHWGRVTHICVSQLTMTGSDNGFLPGRRQAIIWTNAGTLLIGTLGTKFREMKMHLKTSGKLRKFCLRLNLIILKEAPALSSILLISKMITCHVTSVTTQLSHVKSFLQKLMLCYTCMKRYHSYESSSHINVLYINGLVQERRNSSALAMELRLSCI